MTCIVGLEQDGVVYIGGDSAAISMDNLSAFTISEPKVFINKGVIIGYTTSFRMGQLLQYSLSIPKQSSKKTDSEYLVTDFINAVRKCFKKNEWGNGDKGSCGYFLVGYKGKLYSIESDYQVIRTTHGYNACGIGEQYALGALFATKEEKDPKKRIITALEAAANSNAGVMAPFIVLSSKKQTTK